MVLLQVNSALHPFGVTKSSTSFGLGKGGNVTSAGWQVTLCDPMWHVSSRSGVATLRTAIHLLLTYLLTYLLQLVLTTALVRYNVTRTLKRRGATAKPTAYHITLLFSLLSLPPFLLFCSFYPPLLLLFYPTARLFPIFLISLSSTLSLYLPSSRFIS